MSEKLKDRFFTQHSLNAMADAIMQVYPQFDKIRFLHLVVGPEWSDLELKARMRHTTQCLSQTLPDSYLDALHVLKEVASVVTGFEAMCLPDFVEVFGLGYWDASLEALRKFTRYSSSEFAIRPFLDRSPEKGMAFMRSCARDPHENVRRFASEGCRPRLPWAMNLPGFIKDPEPIRPILETLINDPSEFVRRSVANNLNDISKDHPEIMLDWCETWMGMSPHADKIIKHACRTLLKSGHNRALKLFGYGDGTQVKILEAKIHPVVLKIGESTTFSYKLEIKSPEPMRIRLEYVMEYMKLSGKTSRKVFKLTENTYSPGIRSFNKTHAFTNMSTRKHYPGRHRIGLQVNGEIKHTFEVDLQP